MKRYILIAFGCLVIGHAQAGDVDVKKSIAYVQKLQDASGGFRASEPKLDAVKIVPTLRSTSAAVRALKYFGGELPNKTGCIKFVESCWNAEAGGFSDEPKGKPDVFSTAVGLMAVVELKMPADKYADAASKYLSTKAKSFEDVRIAVAGFEAIKSEPANREEWWRDLNPLQNKDPSHGKSQARDWANTHVTNMRLGGKSAEPGTVVKVLNDNQRQIGGWGKADSDAAADLETTYRVMRCYVMLKAKPRSVEGVRSFVAKCRNADGGYAVAPGQPSSVSGTYFAAMILHWLKE